METKLKNISEINDFSKVGFHFSDSEDKILSIAKNGLIPQIGDNSATFEATPKISLSLGLDGLFQTANRFLNLAQTMPLSFFITDTHQKYLPENVKSKDLGYIMSTVEAMEFIRNYFENSSYFVFQALPTKYEHDITPENIEETNKKVNEIMGIPYVNDLGDVLDISYDDALNKYNFSVRGVRPDEPKQNLKDFICTVQRCLENYSEIGRNNMTDQQLKEYKTLLEAKNRAVITVMEESRNSLRCGNRVEDGLYDQVAFHEQKLLWRNQLERPLNVQTRVDIKDGKVIDAKGVKCEDLALLSVDGANKANNLQILSELNDNPQLNNRTIKEDIDLVSILVEYVKIPSGKINEYLSDHPDFGKRIMVAQEHAKKIISKEQMHKDNTNIQQANKSNNSVDQDFDR